MGAAPGVDGNGGRSRWTRGMLLGLAAMIVAGCGTAPSPEPVPEPLRLLAEATGAHTAVAEDVSGLAVAPTERERKLAGIHIQRAAERVRELRGRIEARTADDPDSLMLAAIAASLSDTTAAATDLERVSADFTDTGAPTIVRRARRRLEGSSDALASLLGDLRGTLGPEQQAARRLADRVAGELEHGRRLVGGAGELAAVVEKSSAQARAAQRRRKAEQAVAQAPAPEPPAGASAPPTVEPCAVPTCASEPVPAPVPPAPPVGQPVTPAPAPPGPAVAPSGP